MVWSLALCPDNAKQDPVVYGAQFGVSVPGKGSTSFIRTGEPRECFGLYHWGLEYHFWLVVELT